MPKSKRDKKISLTRTTKKGGLQFKQSLVEEIRKSVENYARIFVFSVQNMRNGKLKDLRGEWKHSRFFFGKNKVMALALGRSETDEVQPNLHKLAACLHGQCGLLFTNKSKNEVIKWFDEYSEKDYARAGCEATETVELQAGPLSEFAHSMEPQLRQLGLPTSLKKGVVTLHKDYTVCREGDSLTPEQARILKLLGQQMAEFKLEMLSIWSNDGTFESLSSKSNPTTEKEGDEEDEEESGEEDE